MAEETQAPEQQPQVIYVEKQTNGMATASLVLGIIGVVFGLVPLTAFIALICGLLAVIFGFVGRKNAKKNGVGKKTMATWGLVLGAVAFALGVAGVVIVDDALNELERELDNL